MHDKDFFKEIEAKKIIHIKKRQKNEKETVAAERRAVCPTVNMSGFIALIPASLCQVMWSTVERTRSEACRLN